MIRIVLPAYDEERSLPPLLREIASTLDGAGLEYAVLVVDDGSTDGTADSVRDLSRSFPVSLIGHPVNLGLSRAIRTGLMEAQRNASPEDVLVTMDADNTHPPGLIPRMARMIGEGFDVVVASRYRPGSRVIGVPLPRKVLSYGASLLFRLLFPFRGVTDYTSGYRAYRASLVREMFRVYGDDFVDRPGFSCMVDILLKVRRHPVAAGEVPLVLRYDRKEGGSKMKVARTVFETVGVVKTHLFGRR